MRVGARVRAPPVSDPGEGDRSRDAALVAWMRGSLPLTIRITVMSFGLTAVASALLLLVHQLLQRQSRAALELPGFTVDLTSVVAAGYDLALLVVALGTWVGLTSLSALLVHRSIRTHLLAARPTDPDPRETDDPDAAPGEGGHAMSERMLMESYLGLVSALARAVGVTVVLVLVAPPMADVGALVAWAAAAGVGWYRFRLGQRASDALRESAQAHRRAPGRDRHRELVDAIYWRDRFLGRLPLGQAAIVLAPMLVLVVVPVWEVSSDRSSVAGLLVIVLWMQALIQAVTMAASLGFRHAFWSQRAPAAARGRNASLSRRPVAVLTAATRWWPDADVVWSRVPEPRGLVIAFTGEDGRVGGMPPARFTRRARDESVDVVVLCDQPFRSGAEGYAGLGSDLESSLSALRTLVDPAEAVIVGCGAGVGPARILAATGPGRRLVEVAEQPDIAERPDAGLAVDAASVADLRPAGIIRDADLASALGPLLTAWLDPDLDEATVRHREREVLGAR